MGRRPRGSPRGVAEWGIIATLLVSTALAGAPALAQETPSNGPAGRRVEPRKELERELTQLASALGPSIVGVRAEETGERPESARERPQTGAGVIVTEDGLVLSSSAVVPEGSAIIEATLEGGRRVRAREVRRQKALGLVLLSLDVPGTLTPAVLGDAKTMRPGSIVVTFGNPFGTLTRNGEPAMSLGVVSGICGDRLETDAAVNPGSFGGPLVDVRGRVVGIVLPDYRSERWLGLARAVDADVVAFVESARRGEQALTGDDDRAGDESNRGLIGIYIYEDDAASGGAKIVKVMKDSAAAEEKLREGDVVLAMNGERVDSSAELAKRLHKVRAGDKVVLHVSRGEGFERDVTLLARARPRPPEEERPYLGLFAVGAPGRSGVGVDEVVPGGPADLAHVKKGDMIVRVDGTEVASKDALAKALKGKKPGDILALEVEREVDGVSFHATLTVKLGRKPVEKNAPATETPASVKKAGYLGVYLKSADGGVRVDGVVPGSPAEAAKLAAGDTIVKVGGEAVDSIDAFTSALSRFHAGEKAEIVVMRDGAKTSITAVLGEKPSQIPPPPSAGGGEHSGKPGYLGVQLEETDGGLKIVKVLGGSPAEQAGLKVGQMVTEIDGQKVDSTRAFADIMHAHHKGDSVALTVDGKKVDVTLGEKK